MLKPKFLVVFGSVFSMSLSVLGQTESEKKTITRDYDLNALQQSKQRLLIENEKMNQKVEEYVLRNNVSRVIETDTSYSELIAIDDSGTPIYYTTHNTAAAASTRTNHLHNGGSLGLNLRGNNLTAHVWDGGIARASHQEYDGGGGSNRYSVGDGSTNLHFHAAHVTGTIMASGVQSQAKGMAPHSDVIGYDWNSDLQEATTAAANGMLVSNHSYGYSFRDNSGNVLLPTYYFGGYIGVSRSWDELLRNAPYYLMVVSAGNNGQDNTANSSPKGGNSQYDKLTGQGTCKNNLVIANANDASVSANGTLQSVSINGSSSQGPTDDLRIKPDITGNGTSVYSTYHNGNSSYQWLTGTSMSAPNVSGTLLLLQEHYNNTNGSYMKAATLKGLALHTADDAGPSGPDAKFGWGLLNAKKNLRRQLPIMEQLHLSRNFL